MAHAVEDQGGIRRDAPPQVGSSALAVIQHDEDDSDYEDEDAAFFEQMRLREGEQVSFVPLPPSEEPTPRRPAPELVPVSRVSTASKDPACLAPWELDEAKDLCLATFDPRRGFHFDFRWRSRHVRLSPDRTSASCTGKLWGGFLLSKEALRQPYTGRWFEVRIDEVSSKWPDGLGIGLAMFPQEGSLPMTGKGEFEGYACELLPRSWMLGYDGRAKICGQSRYIREREMPAGAWKPADLQVGDVLGVLSTRDGDLFLFVNRELKYHCPACGIPWNTELHACIDLDGCTPSISILDSNGHSSADMLPEGLALN